MFQTTNQNNPMEYGLRSLLEGCWKSTGDVTFNILLDIFQWYMVNYTNKSDTSNYISLHLFIYKSTYLHAHLHIIERERDIHVYNVSMSYLNNAMPTLDIRETIVDCVCLHKKQIVKVLNYPSPVRFTVIVNSPYAVG